jgi:hypothetical protein
MNERKFGPVRPGEILLEEFLNPLGISRYRLAKDISVHPRRVNEIVHGKLDHSGHGFALIALFWLVRTLLVESSGTLRS